MIISDVSRSQVQIKWSSENANSVCFGNAFTFLRSEVGSFSGGALKDSTLLYCKIFIQERKKHDEVLVSI